jgi:hypothetical protein
VIRPALAAGQSNNTSSPSALNNPTSPIANSIASRNETWLAAGTQAVISTSATAVNNAAPANLVVLGPEPILPPTRITLSVATVNSAKPATSMSIGTDGLQPFQIVP